MKLCADMLVKIGLLLLLLAFQINEACLDILVRSFNQILTPIIETSEERLHKPYPVDDLTKFYKRDHTGNFVLRDDEWLPANPFVKNTKSKRSSKIKDRYNPIGRSLFEHLNMQGKSNPDEENATEFEWIYDEQVDLQTAQPSIENESNATDRANASTTEGNVNRALFAKSMLSNEDDDDTAERPNAARKVQFAMNDYEYGEEDADIEDDLYAHNHQPKYYSPGDRPIVDFLIKILEMFQVGLAAIAPHSKDKNTKWKIESRSSNQTECGDECTSKRKRKHSRKIIS